MKSSLSLPLVLFFHFLLPVAGEIAGATLANPCKSAEVAAHFRPTFRAPSLLFSSLL